MAETRELRDARRARIDARRVWRCALCPVTGVAPGIRTAAAELREHVATMHPLVEAVRRG